MTTPGPPVTADHTPETEALARELYARGGGILWEGEESWQDHYLGVARDVLASDWFAALRAECDVLREQVARVEALQARWARSMPGDVSRHYAAQLLGQALNPEHPQDVDQERTSG